MTELQSLALSTDPQSALDAELVDFVVTRGQDSVVRISGCVRSYSPDVVPHRVDFTVRPDVIGRAFIKDNTLIRMPIDTEIAWSRPRGLYELWASAYAADGANIAPSVRIAVLRSE